MKFRKNEKAFAQLVPMVLTIVIAFALLFIGIFVNGEISDSLTDTFPPNTAHNATGAGEDSNWRSVIQNQSYDRIGNISTNQDSTIDIVQVVIIITVLASAIAAIFLFTRFGT